MFQSFIYSSSGSRMEASVFKGRHFDWSVIPLCVHWYLDYNLSLRDLEEIMAERGISVDHGTIRRWTLRYAPELLERFNQRKRAVAGGMSTRPTSKSGANGASSIGRSTAMATRSSSGSANDVIWLPLSGFCVRPSNGMAVPRLL